MALLPPPHAAEAGKPPPRVVDALCRTGRVSAGCFVDPVAGRLPGGRHRPAFAGDGALRHQRLASGDAHAAGKAHFDRHSAGRCDHRRADAPFHMAADSHFDDRVRQRHSPPAADISRRGDRASAESGALGVERTQGFPVHSRAFMGALSACAAGDEKAAEQEVRVLCVSDCRYFSHLHAAAQRRCAGSGRCGAVHRSDAEKPCRSKMATRRLGADRCGASRGV